MSDKGRLEVDDIVMWLEWSKSWWQKTKNPLHVWRAFAICLNAEPRLAIPDWCLPYLADGAANIDTLMRGHDFRGERPQLTPQKACTLTAEALGFVRQGKKSAFAEIKEDSSLQLHALNAELGQDALGNIMRERNVSDDRAARLLSKGKRLTRLR
jgi:hypothetical protein